MQIQGSNKTNIGGLQDFQSGGDDLLQQLEDRVSRSLSQDISDNRNTLGIDIGQIRSFVADVSQRPVAGMTHDSLA